MCLTGILLRGRCSFLCELWVAFLNKMSCVSTLLNEKRMFLIGENFQVVRQAGFKYSICVYISLYLPVEVEARCDCA